MKDEMLHSVSHQSSFTGAARMSENDWASLVTEAIYDRQEADGIYADIELCAEVAIETLSEHGWVHAGDRPTENEWELQLEIERLQAREVSFTDGSEYGYEGSR